MTPLADRFLSKVRVDGHGCWTWTAALDPKGYGRFWLDGGMRLAHRVAYSQIVGVIPQGLQLDHLCRNRACVNPVHLEPVTNAENAQRGEVGRHFAERTHCPCGHPYDAENTKVYRGRRYCRACHRLDDRARKRRIRSQQRATRAQGEAA